MAFVYKITNRKNGKFYIGATDKTVAARIRVHFYKASFGQKSKLYSAIRKYGRDSFDVQTIEECVDFFAALERESALIKTLNPEYNLTLGGGGVKGLVFSKNSRRRMSEAKKGRPAAWLSGPNVDEIKKKLSDRAKARDNSVYIGHKVSKETRRKIGLANGKLVKCINDGRIFNTAKEANEFYKIKVVALRAKYGGKTRAGLEFEYLNDE